MGKWLRRFSSKRDTLGLPHNHINMGCILMGGIVFLTQTLILFEKTYAFYIPYSFHISILFFKMETLLNFGRTLGRVIQILNPCIPDYFVFPPKKMGWWLIFSLILRMIFLEIYHFQEGYMSGRIKWSCLQNNPSITCSLLG